MKKIIAVALALVWVMAEAGAARKPDIKCGPWVQNVSETEFTVLWTSSEKVFAWVEVAPDDGTAFESCARPRFYQTVSGRRVAGTDHSIRVSGLEPGKGYRYRIYGKVVKDDGNAYATHYGPARRSGIKGGGMIRTYDRNASGCRFVMLNDIHGKDDRYRALAKDIAADSIDFLLMNGDMVSYIGNMDSTLNHVFGTVPELVSDVPSVWVRGNHETRGREFHLMRRYAPTPTGEPYHLFRQGPVAVLVLDAGEDKPDGNAEYSGTADFDSYRTQQLEWLKQAVKDSLFIEAPVKVAVMHIPAIMKAGSWYGQKWVAAHFLPVLNEAGVDIMLSGHHHKHIYVEAGECGNAFPILANDDTDRLEFEADAKGYVIRTYNQDGEETSSYAGCSGE